MTDSSTKIAVVTGGSGAIGSAICRRLATDGFRVAVHYRSSEKEALATVATIVEKGGEAIAVSADTTSESDVLALFDQVEKEWGTPDLVVANAGLGGGAKIAEASLDDFERSLSVNLTGSFLTLREAARRTNKGGSILFISSILAQRPMAGTGLYSAGKAAIDAMVLAMSKELGEQDITVNSVLPGATIPGMFSSSDEARKEQFRNMSAFGRLGAPDDVAGLVSYLAGKEARFVTGQAITVDGGMKN